MAFQLSPGVLVVEKDLTGIVPAVATSIGGYVGAFQWGPVGEITTISNEGELIRTFGKPNDDVAASWFSAANFLSYANNLKVVRVVGAEALNATSDGSGILIPNESAWEADHANGQSTVGSFAAKFAGELGNSLKISICDGAGWNSNLKVAAQNKAVTFQNTGDTVTFSTAHGLANGDRISFTSVSGAAPIVPNVSYFVVNAASTTVQLSLTLSGSPITIIADGSGTTGTAWIHKALFDSAPGTSGYAESVDGEGDEFHIVVIDEDGLWTGVKGTVLERFGYASKASDAKKSDGTNAYYPNVLRGSRYIYWMDHLDDTNWGSNANTVFTGLGPVDLSLSGGTSDDAPNASLGWDGPEPGDIMAGWDLFANAERVDVNLLINGPSSLTVGKHIIENIAQARMDCLAFVSPTIDAVYNNAGDEAAEVVAERQDAAFNVNSSYGVFDSGWKYQYDKYNDKYRWVPLNADIAGLCARTDNIADPWYSPGGLNRGQIKNVVKLAWSPDKTDRDELYKNGVNPVVSFPGEGTVLFGDKTLLAKPSAFDRINVRRLFIVLEKAIATAGKYQLFEFNDSFTRAQFRNLVEPFLRDVRGRRGIYDFRVVCDETNNTGEVIDRNEFVADIYIKPARSINFMQLNFIATRTGVSFEEVVGA